MDKDLIKFLGLFVLGAVMIGIGITGFAIVSQSCCFPPDCAPENMCEAANPAYERDMQFNYLPTVSGIALFVSSLVFLHSHMKRKGIK
jgi:hypothetical protein